MSDTHTKSCPECHGFGWIRYADGRKEVCTFCDGYGELPDLDGEMDKAEGEHD